MHTVWRSAFWLRTTIVILCCLSEAVQAWPTRQLIFQDANLSYAVLTVNDKYADSFIDFLNASLENNFNLTKEQSASVWNMIILAVVEVAEQPNFFVSDHSRKTAERYLGYMTKGVNVSADPVQRRALVLFDEANKLVPAKPEVVADRFLVQVLYFLLLPVASWFFHCVLWRKFCAPK